MPTQENRRRSREDRMTSSRGSGIWQQLQANNAILNPEITSETNRFLEDDNFIWPLENTNDILELDEIVQPEISPASAYTEITEEIVREAFETLNLDFRNTSPRIIFSGTSGGITGLNPHNIYKLDKHEMKEYKPDDLVKLMDGARVPFKNCVIAHGNFYLKTDKSIVKDFYTGAFIDINVSIRLHNYFDNSGIINISKCDYYYRDRSDQFNNNVIEVYDEFHTIKCDYNSLPKEFYKECFATNRWYHINIAKGNIVDKKQLKIKARKANCIYKASFNRTNLTKDFEMGVVSPTFIKTEGKKYLFGLEMETISGILPQRVDSFLNYMSIRDGSLKDEDGNEYGFEYVTGVLTGDTGLLQTKKLCNELTKRCIVDKRCGLHQHTGGIEFNSELIVFLYKLSLMLEDQIFNMVPLSRRNNEYCKRLKPFRFDFNKEDFNNPGEYKAKIESVYNQIYGFVSSTSELPSSKANKKTQHPLGAKCGYNHNTARYCWMNFVPTIFDTRGNGKNTIENRIIQGSTNFNKIKNWVLINMGILWFAENYKREIALNQEISLKYIMELAYPKTYMEINEYIDLRTNKFSSTDKEVNRNIENNDYREVVESEDLTIKNL
jgi:hypothetical protein